MWKIKCFGSFFNEEWTKKIENKWVNFFSENGENNFLLRDEISWKNFFVFPLEVIQLDRI